MTVVPKPVVYKPAPTTAKHPGVAISEKPNVSGTAVIVAAVDIRPEVAATVPLIIADPPTIKGPVRCSNEAHQRPNCGRPVSMMELGLELGVVGSSGLKGCVCQRGR